MEFEMRISKLYAIGTRGKAAGLEFVAKKNANGKYVLNKKVPSTSASSTNYAVNKVSVDTLDEAWELLKNDQYLINVTGPTNSRALRKLSAIKVEYAK
jgi:transposase-like protein